MTRAALAAFLVLAAGCTANQPGESEPTRPEGGPTGTPTEAPRPDLVVIADPGSPEVEGGRLAADQADLVARLVDPEGDPERALREAIASRPSAVLIVGAPGAVVKARAEIEAAAVPVVEVGGDLYSDRLLFRYTFQVSTPLTWQARVLAHYFVTDRGYERIGVVGKPDVAEAALAEEGVSPDDSPGVEALLALTGPPGGLTGPHVGGPADTLGVARSTPAGTVACAPYTWAGWAEPIPRVARFRERFENRYGREPGLAEQEGYDAMRAVAEALQRTGGRGGDALVRALESFRDETYSSTPIRLGPDDHVFAEQSHLGLFAREPEGVRAPGEDLEPVPWRPVMRTFTTNGKRVNLTDRDVRVFFPSWRPPAPRPNYWRSRYGILSRPDDPLH
jgi:ABC-type branched-subunit amino acid transport system substrate-binding protein